MNKRNSFPLIVLVASLAIGSSLLTRGHIWWDDFASYIMQAQSILRGDMIEFVKHNTFTIFQSSFQIGPVAYPWGFPLILAPVYRIVGLSPLALKLPGLFFFAGFLICLYLLSENRIIQTERILVVSLFAFNPGFLHALDLILSDIPFLFFSTLALLLMMKRKATSSFVENVFLGVVIFFAFFIRTNGIILLASFLVYQIFRFTNEGEQRKNIVIDSFIVSLMFGLLWLIATLIFPNGQGSYIEQLKGFTLFTLTRNITDYFGLFGLFLGESAVWKYVYYLLIPFFLTGVWTRRNLDQPLVLFFTLYLPIMVIWPEWQGIRFIYPILPIFIYLTFQGINFVIGKLTQRQKLINAAVYAFWSVIIVIFFYTSASDAYINLKNNRYINGPFDPYSREVYDFIKDKTPSDSIIIFFKPRVMRLMTNRDTLMITKCERLSLGDYVVISKKADNSQISPDDIDECGLPLEKKFENRRFIIYQIDK